MAGIDKKKILRELSAAAFSDYTDFVSVETLPDGTQALTVTDTAILRPRARRAVAAIKTGTKGIEIKLYDKIKALELMGRSIGMFTDKDSDSEKELMERLSTMLEGVGSEDEEENE